MTTAEKKSVRTSRLDIEYVEWNPGGKRSVVLLHGWPDSSRTWLGIAPVLAGVGYRVLAPSLRGFGGTRFVDATTRRSGELVALGRDLLDFVQALELQQPALVGHDWGARAAGNACGLQPGVASHLVLLSVAYGTNLPTQQLTMAQARNYWYHWYMATPRGQRIVREAGVAFARTLWDTWAPAGWYSPEEFDATAKAFANADWPEVTLHSYQHRWGHAPGDSRYDADEQALSQVAVLDVPTLVLHGGADGVNPPETSDGKAHYFQSRYERQVLPGIGHFPQREAPQRVSAELIRFLET